MTVHKLGVNPNRLVKRNLKLAGPVDENGTQIVAELEAIIGVDAAFINTQRRMLTVHYDASRLQLDEVSAVVIDNACQMSNGRWQRTKRGWYRYFDQNIKENANQEPWKCH